MYIFSGDTLEMRFWFHKVLKVVIKTFAYHMPHLPLTKFLHEVARYKVSLPELLQCVVQNIDLLHLTLHFEYVFTKLTSQDTCIF